MLLLLLLQLLHLLLLPAVRASVQCFWPLPSVWSCVVRLAARTRQGGRDVGALMEELGGWVFAADPQRWDRHTAREHEAPALHAP